MSKVITKEYAIDKFKEFCAGSYMCHIREEKVATQHNRDYWELDLREVILGLSSDKGDFNLLVYQEFGSYGGINRELIKKFTISNEEYTDLKKHYFGNFTVDGYYIKKISSLLAQYESIKQMESETKMLNKQ